MLLFRLVEVETGKKTVNETVYCYYYYFYYYNCPMEPCLKCKYGLKSDAMDFFSLWHAPYLIRLLL